MAATRRTRASVTHNRRSHPLAPPLEALEARVVPSTLEVQLIPGIDEFGNQYATVQVFRFDDGLGDRVTFGIYDTGASPATFGWEDQWFFDFLGQPIPTIPGATVTASGIGGDLTGLVSQPGTLLADGLHALDLDALLGGGEYIDLSTAASVGGVQAMIGTEDGSPDLPTITGTPIMNGTLAGSRTAGVAALIDQYGYLIDFGELFPGMGFDGLVVPMPDLFFVEPGTQLAQEADTTEVVRLPVTFLGLDNHLDPGETITESYNPTVAGVRFDNTVGADSLEVGDQTLLFDTGAQLSVISTELALALGLDLDNPEMEIDVGGAGGSLTVGGYYIDSLTLPRDDDNDGVTDGELVFTDVPVFVLDVGAGLDGIFGMNMLNPASKVVYDPVDPDGEAGPAGPSIQMTFTTGDREGYDDGDILLLNQLFPFFAGMVSGQGLPGFEFDHAPTVAADHDAVTVDEGEVAENTGTFADLDGDVIDITADAGAVTWDAAAGTWAWSLAAADNTDGPVAVTVTATDATGREDSATFTYAVNNVAPTVGLSGDPAATAGAAYTLHLGPVADPGDDTVARYEVHWGDGSSTGVVDGSPAGLALQHVYLTPGARTITVDLYDEDGTHAAAGSKTVAVNPAAPLDLAVSQTGPTTTVVRRDVVTFAVTVSNLGTSAAAGVVVTFDLPRGLSYVRIKGSPAWKKSHGSFRLAVGTLAAGEERTVYLTAKVASTRRITSFTTVAWVGDDGRNGPDADPLNNRAEWTLWVG
jgi:uncharacterized repeat protein (TIGR01451 family)